MTNQTLPWQVTAAVILLATWWVGSYAFLIMIDGRGLGRDDIGPLLGLGLWSVGVFLLLRNTWRGGKSTPFVAGAAFFFGIFYELGGLVVAWLWLTDSIGPVWTWLVPSIIGACPLYAGRLLRTPAARAYAGGAPAGSVNRDRGVSDLA